MRSMQPDRLTLAILSLFCLASFAWADVIHTKDGRTIEGKVLQKGDTYHVKGRYGETTFNKKEIERIEWDGSLRAQYRRKAAAIPEGDLQAHIQLALWCQKKGLDTEFRKQIDRVLAQNPDHKKARMLLGQVKHDGKWMAKEKAAKEQGLIFFRGRYMKPAEKKEILAEEKRRERERKLAREAYRRRRSAALQKRWNERFGHEDDRGTLASSAAAEHYDFYYGSGGRSSSPGSTYTNYRLVRDIYGPLIYARHLGHHAQPRTRARCRTGGLRVRWNYRTRLGNVRINVNNR